MFEGECTTDAVPSPPRTRKTYSGKEYTKKTNVPSEDDNKEDKDKSRQPPSQQVMVYYIRNSSGIQFGNNYIIGNEPKKPQMHRVVETDQIRALKSSTKPVTSDDNNIISQHLSEGWKDLARALGYKGGQIFQFEHNHVRDIRQCLYDLLTDWIEFKGPYEATVGKLAQTMWDTHQREALEVWAEQYDQIHK